MTTFAAGPEASALFPAGGQRGTTFEITASGTFPNWPVQVWVDRPGVAVTASADKGKFSAAIAPDAAPGVYWLRIHDASGAAAPLPLVVGTLREFIEHEPNDTVGKAQAIEATSAVVNGKLGANGDVDLFSVKLTQGQTLVASLVANETLVSPVDAVLEIVSPRGQVLAFNHDEHGLDPQIAFTAPADGSYAVRVFGFPSTPNQAILLAGREQFVYRLTLATEAFVDYTWPLAVTRGSESRVEAFGWNITDELKSLNVKAEGETTLLGGGQLAGATTITVEPHATAVEIEPNDATPQPIELPTSVSGRIGERRDRDAFAFHAAKGETIVLELHSRTLGHSLDGVLEVTDAAGKSLAKVDDAGGSRDPRLEFAVPADGDYRLVVSDLNGAGGSRQVYLLRATRAASDYEVTADANSYVLAVGKPLEITLAIARQHGFAEEIAFRVTGLPPGVTAASATSPPTGDAAKSVKLKLEASEAPFSGPIHIECLSTGATKRAHSATAAVSERRARTSDIWLTVVPARPNLCQAACHASSTRARTGGDHSAVAASRGGHGPRRRTADYQRSFFRRPAVGGLSQSSAAGGAAHHAAGFWLSPREPCGRKAAR